MTTWPIVEKVFPLCGQGTRLPAKTDISPLASSALCSPPSSLQYFYTVFNLHLSVRVWSGRYNNGGITSWHRVLLPNYRQLNEQITIKYGWVWCVAIGKSCSYTSVIRKVHQLVQSSYFKILHSFRVNVVLVIRLFYYKKIHKPVANCLAL